jgi:parallel beta-helix repeat protein
MVSAGDRIRFASAGDLSPRGEYAVQSVHFDKSRYVLMVTLDRQPTSVQAGDLAIDLAKISSNFRVRRNYFHNNRGRGIVIQTANGRVENNTVENVSQGGIRLTTDAAYFWQGPGVDNVVVTANSFRSCDWGTYARYPDSTVVSVDAYVLTTAIARYPVNRNVIIEKNIITSAPGLAILISSASGVTVDSNKIIDTNLLPFPTDLFPPFAGSLMVTYASSIIIGGNEQTATRPAYAAGICVDRATTSEVTLAQNAMSIICGGRRAARVVAPRR